MENLTSFKKQSWLVWFLKGILILGFFVLAARMFDLQVIRGSYYRSLSEGNRIRRVPIIAPRGVIYARGGEVLVGNREVKKKVVFYPDKSFEKSTDISGADESEIITESVRNYVLDDNFAHVSGYLGEVNKNEVGKVDPLCPEKGPRRLGSWVGRTGLEEIYECFLSGYDGEELVEVDSLGNKVRTLGRRESIPGKDLKTTIDYELQKKVSSLMKDKKGAIVVSDPQGQVLALYSSPSFDPNVFVFSERGEAITKVLNDENLPMFNRAVGGLYHPGSVYKPVVAIAGLEEKVIDKNFKYNDKGEIVIESIYGRFSYSNWYFTQYGGMEGEIDVVRAMARSTDTFFYKLGELSGIDNLTKWAREFNLDKRMGIDITGEAAGIVPDPEWKEKVKGERWFLGNTYHVSIGQGDLALTPLSVNSMIGTIANDGEFCNPHIIGYSEMKDYGYDLRFGCKSLNISGETLRLVKQGMIQACEAGGTGFTFFDAPIEVACKTGTAEIDEISKDTHAWFVFFAPVEESEIVVTVFVERGGEGSKAAGPVARELFDYWFEEEEKEI